MNEVIVAVGINKELAKHNNDVCNVGAGWIPGAGHIMQTHNMCR